MGDYMETVSISPSMRMYAEGTKSGHQTVDGRVFEVLVTTQWSTQPIETKRRESDARQAAKRFMRGMAPENTCQSDTTTQP